MVGMGGDAVEDIFQVRFWIQTGRLGIIDQGIEQRAGLDKLESRVGVRK
jgi:hypothetical protein